MRIKNILTDIKTWIGLIVVVGVTVGFVKDWWSIPDKIANAETVAIDAQNKAKEVDIKLDRFVETSTQYVEAQKELFTMQMQMVREQVALVAEITKGRIINEGNTI